MNQMPMKVKDLKPNTNASVRVKVCIQGNSRKAQSKQGYQFSVCPFVVGDETGAVEYSSFGKDIMSMGKNVGKVIDIKDGWVKEWNEKLQISLGKSGTWEVVDDKTLPLISEIMKLYERDAKKEDDGDSDRD